tara:strand:+ start:2535 stop:3140 length:606 start_codon:yes stop_codon:yes gene_type:complete
MGENLVNQSLLNKSRSDKFILVITIPELLRNIDQRVNRSNSKIKSKTLQYSIFGSPVPEISVPEIETPFAGHTFKFSSFSRPSYGNIDVKFTVDNEYNNYWVIWKWLDMMQHSREGTFDKFKQVMPDLPYELPGVDHEYHKLYAANMSIIGRDEYDNDRIRWDYIGAFPVSLGRIEFNDRDDTEIESSFSFTFSQMDSKLL